MKKWIQRRPTNVWLFVCLSSCVVMSLISFLFMGWQSMNIPSSTTKTFDAVSSLVMFQTTTTNATTTTTTKTTTGEETTHHHHHHQTGRGGVGMDHDNDENENDHYNKKRNGLSPKAIQNWCPTAQCHVTDLCHPCQRRYLIIITTGRSGSTTIQKMLNDLPGIRLSGENNGMLTNFQYAISATRDRKQWSHIGIQNPYSPWHHNSYPTSAFACIVQQMIEIINPPPNINGKIIHHQKTRTTTSTTTNLLEEPTEQEDEDDDDSDTIIGFKTIRFPLDTSIMSGTKGIARGGGRQQEQRRQQQWKQNNHHNDNNTHHRDATAAAASSSSFELLQQEQQLWLQSVAATMASQQPQQQQQSSSSDLLLYKTAQFLNETLPCAKFVINIRSDSYAHAKAIHKVWGNGYNLQHLVHASQQRTKELLQLANYLGAASSTTTSSTATTMSTLSSLSSSRVAIMDSSKWMSNVSLINELISWLGYTTPACSFDRLFQYNTNNTKNGLYGRGQYIQRDKNPIDCHALLSAE